MIDTFGKPSPSPRWGFKALVDLFRGLRPACAGLTPGYYPPPFQGEWKNKSKARSPAFNYEIFNAVISRAETALPVAHTLFLWGTLYLNANAKASLVIKFLRQFVGSKTNI